MSTSFRLTKPRRELLAFLKERGGAWSAAQLHHALPHIDLTTIYRNLELFTSEHLIKKLHLTTGEALFEYQKTPHHHAVCDACQKIIHLELPDERVRALLNINAFDVTSVDIVVHGTCC